MWVVSSPDVSVSGVSHGGDSHRGHGVLGGGSDDGLAGGLGQLVLDILAGDLGDGVAVLDLDGDLNDLGVVNAVLGGDLTAGVLHSLGDGVGHGVGHGQRSNGVGESNGGDMVGKGSSMGDQTGVGKRSTVGNQASVGVVLGISISIGLSLGLSIGRTLVVSGVGQGGVHGGVTQGVNDLSADLLVLDLLGGDGLGGADLHGGGGADLGDEDHVLGDTVGGGDDMVVGHGSGDGVSQGGAVTQEVLGVSLGLGGRGGAGEGDQAGQGENLQGGG